MAETLERAAHLSKGTQEGSETCASKIVLLGTPLAESPTRKAAEMKWHVITVSSAESTPAGDAAVVTVVRGVQERRIVVELAAEKSLNARQAVQPFLGCDEPPTRLGVGISLAA